MTIQLKIPGVCERDLDLLLLEELVASHVFRAWFADRCAVPAPIDSGWFDVQRSVTQSLGESDLEFTFESSSGLVRLLIENKVDAGFQVNQADRYRARAESALVRDNLHVARTVLVAPHGYAPEGDTKGFDLKLTYEEIGRWFGESFADSDRSRYKLALLNAAIEKSRLGYQPLADAPVTNFWKSYWLRCHTSAAELAMQEPSGKPAGAGFIYFRPVELPKGVEICHKLPHGNVDLQFSGWGDRLGEFGRHFSGVLDDDMSIVKANKSAVVRLKVALLDAARPFSEQAAAAQQGIDAAARLLSWYRLSAKPRIEHLVASA